ncbi:phosphoenolpyruvate--protein phosphotransferase [Nocardioides immobilis]|uniref:Phosphoenolpyruvate-protein phosphotransferase n=1 Tax=Nocardioides immobilis TaxID=2049295 RepID=A0A417Y2E2_9ACTN|nr:phosphoenolpyruvate--protein phosphotransferase [Nocardioides immobilis]RHW26828.1 phosphoenolpyruvate--protein phosphotransferase [Nocardioides immobilis]
MVTSIHGTPVVPGLAFGPVLIATSDVSTGAVAAYGDGGHADAAAALAAYDEAVAQVADGFRTKAAASTGATAEVLTASAGLASDRGLRAAVRKNLNAGQPLLAALDAAVEQFVNVFAGMGGLMAERVTDLRDIHARMLARLVGEPEPGVPVPTAPSVLVALDLAPADTAGLDPSLVVAIVTERGGKTSHTSIIARQLGIPCVVGASGAIAALDGHTALVDGELGTIEVDPEHDKAAALVAEDRAERAVLATWSGPGRTADGRLVKLLANVADAASSVAASAEPVTGIGLFRTELCFLDRETEPTVEEQADIYASVLAPFAGEERHVVVRTLDAGSDKPIAFATHPDEENPALGVRGLRLAFADRGLLHRQLDAIAIAAERTGADCWVMAPMVATVAEARDFAADVRERGLKPGVMVEVPSAALLAHKILEEVDFLSIGTNDLTQYTMAADRMATDLAHLTDPWQPAVLQLVAIAAEAGRQAGKPVGVCGEAAADPLLACVLVGLGITSLSMASAAVRPVGARVSELTVGHCEEMADAALAAVDPATAREAARAVLL